MTDVVRGKENDEAGTVRKGETMKVPLRNILRSLHIIYLFSAPTMIKVHFQILRDTQMIKACLQGTTYFNPFHIMLKKIIFSEHREYFKM